VVEVVTVFVLHTKALETLQKSVPKNRPSGYIRKCLKIVSGCIPHMSTDPSHTFKVRNNTLGRKEDGHGVQPRGDVFFAGEGGHSDGVVEGMRDVTGLGKEAFHDEGALRKLLQRRRHKSGSRG
jgi:hypothetical protein